MSESILRVRPGSKHSLLLVGRRSAVWVSKKQTAVKSDLT